MIAVSFSRTELELLLSALEVAGHAGWPTGDNTLRVKVTKQRLEKAVADLRAQGWQGGR